MAGFPPPDDAVRVLVMTDLVDSTRLTQNLDAQGASEFWRRHDRLSRDLMRLHDALEIDSSDGYMLLFDTVARAVGFALDYHRSLASLGVSMLARVGVHAGELVFRANDPHDVARGAKPMEIDGSAKAMVSRVMSIALGGQTLVTAMARATLGRHPAAVAARGHWRLKGFEEPVELFEVAADRSALLGPPPEAAKAYRVIESAGLWLPRREIAHSLPAGRNAFVGRRALLQALRERLGGATRLVSLVGVGGVGKTRLAQHFSWSQLGDYPGGVWYCDLAQARSLGALSFAVSQGLRTALASNDAVVEIGNAIAGRPHCLVVLDNFEHLAAHAEETLGHWLERTVEASFLVTSREPLRIVGEDVLRIEPMDRHEALDLFQRRSTTSLDTLPGQPGDSASVEKLVEMLDRLPLAIELAAARTSMLRPDALLARLSERFQLLVSRGGRSGRQASLRIAFDSSWELLRPDEQAAFAALSVIEGSCSLAVAEALLGDDQAQVPAVDLLQSLIDKSLLRHRFDDRYDMLSSVREYAAEQLRALERRSDVPVLAARARDRHAAFYADLADDEALLATGIELDNIVAACRHACARAQHAAAAGALERAWAIVGRRGPFRMAVELARRVARVPNLPPSGQLAATFVEGSALHRSGEHAMALIALDDCVDAAARLRDERIECLALNVRGDIHLIAGGIEQSRNDLTRALQMARSACDLRNECITLGNLGNLAENVGENAESLAYYEGALHAARELRDRRHEGGALGNIGLVLDALGRADEAQHRYEQALTLTRFTGDRQWEGNTLCNLGLLHHRQGRTEQARAALEASLAVAGEIGHVRLAAVARCNLALVCESVGEDDAAAHHYGEALEIARRSEDRRSQGQFLAPLGLLHAKKGDFKQARRSFASSQALLLEVRDRQSVAATLVMKGHALVLERCFDEARGAIAEADALRHELGADEASELGQSVASAAALLAAACEGCESSGP